VKSIGLPVRPAITKLRKYFLSLSPKPSPWKSKRPVSSLETSLFRREGGIRTPGPVTVSGFQDRRNRPLCHFSRSEMVKRRTGEAWKLLHQITTLPFRREGGIRTPDTLAGITDFESVAFDHSATSLGSQTSGLGCKSREQYSRSNEQSAINLKNHCSLSRSWLILNH
jgi:hypothetical protein